MAETVTETKAFKPYIPDDANVAELTPRALIIGMLFGIVFGAVTVYVGLRAGLTVGASIPIAVLSISVLRALGRPTILENNIVQTTGSAGESVAGGVIFTLPALIFLGFGLEYSRILVLALIGGFIGVLFMIATVSPILSVYPLYWIVAGLAVRYRLLIARGEGSEGLAATEVGRNSRGPPARWAAATQKATTSSAMAPPLVQRTA